MDFESHCEVIRDMIQAIPLDGTISVLTGGNGTGKSLVRSQLNFRLPKGKNVVHCSMALRTGGHAHLGGLGALLRDNDDNSTSYSTFRKIQTALKSIHGSYLCLDEIEIGCSIETTMGITNWLNDNLRQAVEGTHGCLVITHSPYVVEHLDHDHWFNMDGHKTACDWLNREIVPTDMNQYVEDQHILYKTIQKRMQKKDSQDGS
jgi:hypothetical protein